MTLPKATQLIGGRRPSFSADALNPVAPASNVPRASSHPSFPPSLNFQKRARPLLPVFSLHLLPPEPFVVQSAFATSLSLCPQRKPSISSFLRPSFHHFTFPLISRRTPMQPFRKLDPLSPSNQVILRSRSSGCRHEELLPLHSRVSTQH